MFTCSVSTYGKSDMYFTKDLWQNSEVDTRICTAYVGLIYNFSIWSVLHIFFFYDNLQHSQYSV